MNDYNPHYHRNKPVIPHRNQGGQPITEKPFSHELLAVVEALNEHLFTTNLSRFCFSHGSGPIEQVTAKMVAKYQTNISLITKKEKTLCL